MSDYNDDADYRFYMVRLHYQRCAPLLKYYEEHSSVDANDVKWKVDEEHWRDFGYTRCDVEQVNHIPRQWLENHIHIEQQKLLAAKAAIARYKRCLSRG